MAKKRIIVLGAGLSGLSVAWHLRRKKGYDCRVFEKETEPGGLCRSKPIGGFTFDYDGHLLHFRHPYAFRLIKNLLGDNLAEHRRSAWIYFRNSYTRYPFQANLYGLPSSVAKECLLGIIEARKNRRIKKQKDPNFLDWIYSTFGMGIARHFMIPYNTKFWTLPPRELSCLWFDGFIPVPSLAQTIEGALEENDRQFGYNARFWYPKRGGISEVPKVLSSQIENLYTGASVTGIDLEKKEIEINSSCRERFDYLVSTLPLPELPCIIKGLPKGALSLFHKLKWNSIFNLNLGVEGKSKGLDRHWIYFSQPDISFFRVGFFHNFSSFLTPPNKSSLYAEVSYSKSKPLDKDKAVLRMKEDLMMTGILGSDDKIVAEDTNDIKYGYPIYDKNYYISRKGILGFLMRNNIISCGRYGSWRYMSMEAALLDGKDVAGRFAD